MQQSKKKNKTIEPIVKPILYGTWNSKEAYKLAPKRTLSILLIALVYVFFSIMAGFDNAVLQIILSIAIVGVVFYFQCNKGMEAGEKDAAFSEILYERQTDGRNVTQEDLQRCFHPMRGAYATLLGAIPFLIVCIVYAFMAKPWSYQLGVLPSWTDSLLMQNEFSDAVSYYGVTHDLNLSDILRIIVRCLTMPFVNIASVFGKTQIVWVERFSAILMLIGPMGFGLGYSRGHALRTQINTGIAQGVEKKKRKERKARRQRQRSSSPERLI